MVADLVWNITINNIILLPILLLYKIAVTVIGCADELAMPCKKTTLPTTTRSFSGHPFKKSDKYA
jgi:hypothetical protein